MDKVVSGFVVPEEKHPGFVPEIKEELPKPVVIDKKAPEMPEVKKPEVKKPEVKKPEVKESPKSADDRVEFIKDGVTIRRNPGMKFDLEKNGWKVK